MRVAAMASPAHLDAVGAHIGDEPDRLAADVDAFIEALGDLHGLGRGEAELARGFLLQASRCGTAGRDGAWPACSRPYRRVKRCPLSAASMARAECLIGDIELAELLAVDGVEPGRERVAAWAS